MIDGASLVHGLDSLPNNIWEDREWHRSCDHQEWARYVSTYINTISKPALADTFSVEAREYIDSIMTSEIEKKLTDNAAKTITDVAEHCSIPVPGCLEDLLGGTTDNAFDSSPPSTVSGVRETDEKVAPTQEQILFQIETGDEGTLAAMAADISGRSASENPPSMPRLAADQARFDPIEFPG